MLLMMRMMMMRTLMITIIVWKTMVKSTTWWWSRSSRIFRRFVWLKTGALPKSQWGVAFCLKTVLSTRTSILCFFRFSPCVEWEKKWFVLVWICAHIWLETNITPSSLLFRDAIVGIICHVLLLDAGPFYCGKVRSGCQLWLFQKSSSSPSNKPCHCRRRGGCQLWLSRKLSE